MQIKQNFVLEGQMGGFTSSYILSRIFAVVQEKEMLMNDVWEEEIANSNFVLRRNLKISNNY